MLFALAIAGSPAPLSQLAHALHWPARALVLPLRRLVELGWIRVQDGQVRVTQPLLVRVAPALMPPERRALLRRLLLRRLHTLPARGEHVALYLDSGEIDRAIESALDVADAHLDDLQTADALVVLEKVTGLSWEDADVDPDRLSRVLLLHAWCLLMVRPVDPGLARSLSGADR